MTEHGDPGSTASRATRLRLARRLDWRFLLGDPALGEVGLAGPPDAGLRAALEACAASVSDGGEVDLLVLTRGVTDADLRTAIARVRPGGQIVAESSGLLGWRPRRRSASGVAASRRTTRALRNAGFAAMNVAVVWPGHGRATALIPSADRNAVTAWVSRKLPKHLWRLAAPAVSVGHRFGLITLFAPAVVIVARRPIDAGADSGADPGAVEAGRRSAGWLADRLGTPAYVAITPRFGASGHVVALGDLTAAPDGGPRAVLKVARLDDDDGGIRHEADALRWIGSSLGIAGLAPRPLEDAWDATPPYLIESGVPGPPLDRAAVRRDPRGAARAVADLVAVMPVSASPDRPLADLLAPALETVRRMMEASDVGTLVTDTDRLLAAVADRLVPVVHEHGDLAHPNLVRTPSGALGAVDWERARDDGLPLHDLSIGLAYVAAAARGATTAADQAAAYQAALTGPAPWVRDLVDAELARLGIDLRLRAPLLVAPWVRSAAWLAERVDPSTWLADRSIAHWRAMLDASPEHA